MAAHRPRLGPRCCLTASFAVGGGVSGGKLGKHLGLVAAVGAALGGSPRPVLPLDGAPLRQQAGGGVPGAALLEALRRFEVGAAVGCVLTMCT